MSVPSKSSDQANQSLKNLLDRDLDQRSGRSHGNSNDRNGQHYDSPALPTPQKSTPLPKLPLFVLSIVIFTEPVSSSILFPFVYFMVRILVPWIKTAVPIAKTVR